MLMPKTTVSKEVGYRDPEFKQSKFGYLKLKQMWIMDILEAQISEWNKSIKHFVGFSLRK